MSRDYTRVVEEIIEAYEDSYSQEGVYSLERAANIADSHQDIELGIRARKGLIRNATFSGMADRALVAFTWVLAQVDRRPEWEEELFYSGELMWMYKWIARDIVLFPQISRRQIMEVLDDITRRYRERGLSLRAVEGIRSKAGRVMGDREMAQTHFEKWNELPEDGSEDCDACEMDFVVRHYLFMGDLDEAMYAVEPLDKGVRSCLTVPCETFSALLLPLFKAGRLKEADDFQRRSQGQASGDPFFIAQAGQHLQFLTVTDQTGKAAGILERQAKAAFRCPQPVSKLHFLMGASLFLKRLEQIGKDTLRLRLDSQLPVQEEQNGCYRVSELGSWMEEQAERIAEQLDQRNGNDYYGRLLDENQALLKQVRPLEKSKGAEQ